MNTPIERRALVTGATGFVGSHLARRLLRDGYDVHILLRPSSRPWRISDILPRVRVHTGDLLDLDALKERVASIRPGIIFHLANAGVYGGRHLPEGDLTRVNFLGTQHLLAACRPLDYLCLVNTGSSAEYGPKAGPMSEVDACDPVTPYGITKLASTLCGRIEARTRGKPVISLRLFSPYGPYDDPSRLVSYAVAQALRGAEIELADPGAVRDYVHIDDVVEAFMLCVGRAARHRGEIVNIGSGAQTSVSTVVGTILSITGSRSAVRWGAVPPRAFDAPRWEADIRAARRLLGWGPRISLEEGLRSTIEWHRGRLSASAPPGAPP